ncbi:sensor histidine kinase [Streptomyces stramineus]
MGMWTRVRGWRGRSGVARVDSYTRWSLYLLPWFFILIDIPPMLSGGGNPFLVGAVLGSSVVQAVVSVRLVDRTLDHRLGRGPAPWRRLAWCAVLYLVTVAAVALGAVSGSEALTGVPYLLMGSGLSVLGSYSVLVRVRLYLPVCTGVGAVLGGASALLTREPVLIPVAVIVAVALAVWNMLVVRTSAWMLSVMWELEAARGAQARLAVAEERLRFGRDMHDVLGRNLAVIALKSELAVQLARRGSPGAAAEMAEVQRVAQESQREVRDVVRGYREADLHTELVGARSVLTAAGIDCRIDDAAGDALPRPVQSALAWVVREATTNVLRHADAGRCALRMRVVDGVAVLVVENDGVPRSPGGGPGERRLGPGGPRRTARRPGRHADDGTPRRRRSA